jgi:DNA polymerase III subunit delta
MHAVDFLRHPEETELKPIYAVFGDESFLRQQAIEAISRIALGGDGDDLAITRFPGDKTSLANVLDEARTLPFLAPRRVVVVEDADPFVSAHRQDLERYADHTSATGVLVLSVKTWPMTTKLAKRVEVVGLSIECTTPSESTLSSWLIALARARGVKLEQSAAQLMVELVGPEPGLLSSEVEKLSVYVGDQKVIRDEDVARMVGAGRVQEIWKILDAATTGQGGRALVDLDRLIASGEHPVGLLAAMTFSLRKIHYAGMLRRARRNLADACREAGLFKFAMVEKQHAHLGPTRVSRLPEMLLKADLDLKGSSQLPDRVVLERLIVQLASPRQD